MVNKLLKHEFVYYFRSYGLFLPIVLLVGVMARVFQCFDQENVIVQIVSGTSFVMLFVASIALLVLATVVGVVRFYKNMYSAEGYLTFTLPVTNAEHIFVKLFTAVVFQLCCVLLVLLSGGIALSKVFFVEISQEIGSVKDQVLALIGETNLVGYAFEIVVLLITSAATNMLLYYACITVGQTAKKNRILMAFGAYFIYYAITQVISTVASILFSILGATGVFDGTAMWIEMETGASGHIFFCGTIVLNIVQAVIFWIVTQTIMHKKLNLE